MKLTKSQIKLAARLFVASSVWNDAQALPFYETSVSDEDQERIAAEQRELAYKIAAGHPMFSCTQEIEDYVRTITRKK